MQMIHLSAALKCQTTLWQVNNKRGNLAVVPVSMGKASPALLREETTINLHFWHAHCSTTPPTNTTCTTAPRREAQTHLSNTQDVLQAPPPPPSSLSALHQCKYNYLDVQQRPPSPSEWNRTMLSPCVESFLHTYVCAYICRQTLVICGRTSHKTDHTHSNTNTMCPWFSTQLGLFSSAGSLSDLNEGWMEVHHSWRISTYLHYVRGDERREMDRFLLPEREFLTSCTAMVFFSTKIWGEGQVKRLFSLDKVLIWMEEWVCECVCVCVFTWHFCVCSDEKSGQGWIVAVFGSGPLLNNVKIVV